MWAMIVKEFRQIRRDRRTLAMMILMPIVLLVVLGYAASFEVSSIPVAAAGPDAAAVAGHAAAPVHRRQLGPGRGRTWAADQLRDGHAAVSVVTGAGRPASSSTAPSCSPPRPRCRRWPGSAAARAARRRARPRVTVLYNPKLTTSFVMIPGLAGVVLVFIGTIITSLGVVRERQSGTLEQLAVMPLRPRDVYLGKIVPYFAVAAVDLAIVLAVGIAVFGVPFRGSAAVFALGALLFLFVTLGIGVLISSVSQNQGQAIQLAVMTLLPQVLLSGLIFPLSSIAAGVRWIAYFLPLTYFNEISRGVMLRAEPVTALAAPLGILALLGVVVVTLATLRFRSFLAPAAGRPRAGAAAAPGGRPARRPAAGLSAGPAEERGRMTGRAAPAVTGSRPPAAPGEWGARQRQRPRGRRRSAWTTCRWPCRPAR